jgi:hypothetical protein
MLEAAKVMKPLGFREGAELGEKRELATDERG